MDDAQIERVARAICRELGLDPDEQRGHGCTETMTAAELREAYPGEGPHAIPAIWLYSPEWELYRRDAEKALAVAAALNSEEAGDAI